MLHAFSHPSSDYLMRRIKDSFQHKVIYQRKERHIIFLCGGSTVAYKRSMRKRFLKHFSKTHSDLQIILAESAISDINIYNDHGFINLADFETLIVAISDCILIFPESPGSIAELGFFANNEDAVKKLLVVNKISEQNDSFINNGLMPRINSKSIFQPVLFTDFSNPNFSQIEKRLTDRLHKTQSKKFKYIRFSKLSIQQKMYVIFQILYIFRVLNLEGIIHCIEKLFSKTTKKINTEIMTIMSILISGEIILRIGDDSQYFMPSPNVKPFLDFRNIEVESLRTETTSFFNKHHDETYKLIEANS